METTNEIWKPIYENVANELEISNLGNIRQYGKILDKYADETNWICADAIDKNGKAFVVYIEKAVFEKFVENPYGIIYFQHKNGNRTDCRAENMSFKLMQRDKIDYKLFDSFRLLQIDLQKQTMKVWPSINSCCQAMNYNFLEIADACVEKSKIYEGCLWTLLD